MKSGSRSAKTISRSRKKSPKPLPTHAVYFGLAQSVIDRPLLVELILQDRRGELGMGPMEARKKRGLPRHDSPLVDTYCRTRGDGPEVF